MSVALDVFIFGTAWIHVLLAPYTKVEESFNLHATHDILMYGVGSESLHNYDHFVFPGAVPRSFIGSLALAWLSTPALNLAGRLGMIKTKFDLQIIVRLVLASLNAATFCLLRRTVSRRFGRLTGLYFAILTCTQFHLPFWLGRTLPNMFALVPVNVASYLLLNRASNSTRPASRDVHIAIACLTFTTVVLRAEVLLLLCPVVLQCLVLQYTTLSKVIKVGTTSALVSLALTLVVDSYFWGRWPLWPEFAGIYFNVYEGKSSDWGISPPHTYFTAHLPKLLLSSLPLSVVGAFIDSRIRSILFPPLAFICLISGLGHKEWRFVIYAVPLFNIAAARGARSLAGLRKGSILGRLCILTVAGLIASNCLATYLLTRASMANYPGGFALARFNEDFSYLDKVHVHISNLAAQTGASLFLHTHAPPYPPKLTPPDDHHWIYNKTEGLDPVFLTSSRRFTHLIAEGLEHDLKKWNVVDTVQGFDRWWVNPRVISEAGEKGLRRIWDVVSMVQSEKLYILERKGI